jgi:site-specific DNA-methyltransferase (adenine-specific)
LYTYKDDIVLDPFVGSGTTVVAAARTGRIGVGYDTDPEYIDLSQRRFDAELSRRDQLDEATRQMEQAPFELQQEVFSQLSHEDRQEHFQARAVREGKKARDIARRQLEDAGFDAINEKAKHPSGILEFNFHLTSPSGSREWWVDVSGAFTTSRPGLQRTDTIWKMLGRLHVLQAMHDGQNRKDSSALVLTSNLPKLGSPGDRALRSVGPRVIFDVIELYDPAGLERLRAYASAADPEPLPGFWTEQELADSPN